MHLVDQIKEKARKNLQTVVLPESYDERMLSNTKLLYMYTPGSTPVTFVVDGVRFGCTMGMEVHYPELFLEYERLDL